MISFINPGICSPARPGVFAGEEMNAVRRQVPIWLIALGTGALVMLIGLEVFVPLASNQTVPAHTTISVVPARHDVSAHLVCENGVPWLDLEPNEEWVGHVVRFDRSSSVADTTAGTCAFNWMWLGDTSVDYYVVRPNDNNPVALLRQDYVTGINTVFVSDGETAVMVFVTQPPAGELASASDDG